MKLHILATVLIILALIALLGVNFWNVFSVKTSPENTADFIRSTEEVKYDKSLFERHTCVKISSKQPEKPRHLEYFINDDDDNYNFTNEEIKLMLNPCKFSLEDIEYNYIIKNVYLYINEEMFSLKVIFLDWAVKGESSANLEKSYIEEHLKYTGCELTSFLLQEIEKNDLKQSGKTSLKDLLSLKDFLLKEEIIDIAAASITRIWARMCAESNDCSMNPTTPFSLYKLNQKIKSGALTLNKSEFNLFHQKEDEILILIVQRHMPQKKNRPYLNTCKQFNVGIISWKKGKVDSV
ncbi:hypothetical protein EDEG_02554 [Edhazardia aedis USNM 41457]|uniref:Uncharacterized protein n=1 Tax=Edhazardia aedis (strain USNM 41457) TaxID=1003232 RepID=J9DKG6_EDHAE|nr:hypothetical protein EDEG_02554 [Edhazardia aedis USNM 41457]|eukprot:EJW03075.1 hypothetical protein EDEG_02554 [Edhazardia aedis USNM 41457]